MHMSDGHEAKLRTCERQLGAGLAMQQGLCVRPGAWLKNFRPRRADLDGAVGLAGLPVPEPELALAVPAQHIAPVRRERRLAGVPSHRVPLHCSFIAEQWDRFTVPPTADLVGPAYAKTSTHESSSRPAETALKDVQRPGVDFRAHIVSLPTRSSRSFVRSICHSLLVQGGAEQH